MSQLFAIFLNNLAPIALIAGAGYLLGHFTRANPRTLSQVIFYIFSPCLLFTLLTTSQLNGGEILRVMGFAALIILLNGLLTWGIGRALHLEKHMLSGVLLVSMFMNAGNYGMPVVLFAFGQTALSYASLFFSMSLILAYTVGAVIASAGTLSAGKALLNLVKIPAVYALALVAVFMSTGLPIPAFLARTTKLLGDASIPAMLVLLGFQLHSAAWTQYKLPIFLGSTMRLLVSPLLTWLLIPFSGLTGPGFQAVILESAMPSAVLNTMLATEFGTEPSYVSAVIFITTVLSPLTLTPLLAILGA